MKQVLLVLSVLLIGVAHVVCAQAPADESAQLDLVTVSGSSRNSSWIDLFNGVDLSGWVYGETPWEVEGGILRNAGRGNDKDWIMYEKQLSSERFTLEIRLRVVDCTNDYPRVRIWLNSSCKFYLGNEGFENRFRIYGSDLIDVNQISDDSYNIGDWYVLRLVVDDQNQVSFFKNGILTHTATRVRRSPLQLSIKPGDGWSAGHIEISSVKYIAATIWEPDKISSKMSGKKEEITPAILQKEPEKKVAVLGVQANWPYKIRRITENSLTYVNRKNKFKEVPDFLKGLDYTLQYRKRIMNISCHVKDSGILYLGLFGDITPEQIGQQGTWGKCGTLKISGLDENQSMTVYKTYEQKDKILIFNQRDTFGLTVFAKEITKDKTRPLPKMPVITTAKKYTAGKSVENRPIEYLVFGHGQDVVFILATIHGDEYVGTPLVHRLAQYLDKHSELLKGRKVVLLPNANPDGMAHFNHFNVNGVNLNRNFKSSNRRNSKQNGLEALSEPEALVIHEIIEKYSPDRVVSIHQLRSWVSSGKKPPGMVDYEGPAEALAKQISYHCKLPVKRFGTQYGSLGAYVGNDLGTSIITLELLKFDYSLTLEQLWEKYGTALLTSVTYPDRYK